MQCCKSLADAGAMTCDLVAANADDATCDQYKSIACATASADAGANACKTLNQCCDSLPKGPVRVACASTVMTGMPAQCDQLTTALCPPGGDPNACMTLSSCCATLKGPPSRTDSCNAVVQQGLVSACQSVQAALCP
jgi:hypothetical protein